MNDPIENLTDSENQLYEQLIKLEPRQLALISSMVEVMTEEATDDE